MSDLAYQILRREDDLYELFRGAEKPREAWRIGAEAEKFGVERATGKPLLYLGAGGRGVKAILEMLDQRHGWEPEPESPGGPLIALRRRRASVTLEPGAQLELSGAPLADMHAIDAETRGHLAELNAISSAWGVAWLGLGFHPFARQADLDWVPKARYGIMQQYLPSRGAHGLDMMRRTCTVQANYDFSSEADALRKLRVALKLSPVTTAMFANSPFHEGAPWGGRSYRAKVWLDVDAARTGLVERAWRPGATYADYVQWALDAPMFLLKRDHKPVENTGQSFRSFLRHGFHGHRATFADWESHINTLFPEVRLKRTLEIRGADAQGAALLTALPALWTGVLYDERALSEAEALCADFTHDELLEARRQIPTLALQTPFRGKTLVAVAERLVDIASGGLERRGCMGPGGDERVLLAGLEALVSRGRCPADDLLDGLDAGRFVEQVIARSALPTA